MRFFVAGAMYRANGALFRTIETVAGEKPLDFATSFIVMVWFFPLCRLTAMSTSEGMNIMLLGSLTAQWSRHPLAASFCGHLKGKLLPEATRLPHAESYPRCHPDRARNHRVPAQVQRYRQADEKPQHRL